MPRIASTSNSIKVWKACVYWHMYITHTMLYAYFDQYCLLDNDCRNASNCINVEQHQRNGKHVSTSLCTLHIQCYTLTLINTVRWTTIAVTTSVQSTSLSIITAALKDERNFGQPQCSLLLCIVELCCKINHWIHSC